MTFKFTTAAAAIALSLASGQVLAQDVGTTIIGNDDVAIGTVTSNDGSTIVVDTGTHEVPLATSAFAERDGNWTLNTTKTDLDTAMSELVAEQEAALAAALVEGAPVVTFDAQALGSIETINADNIIVVYEEKKMTLPKNLFALDDDGAVMVLATLADIMAAVDAQG